MRFFSRIQEQISWNQLKMKGMIQYHKSIHFLMFVLSILGTAWIMYILNQKTPWVVDDLLKVQAIPGLIDINSWIKHIEAFYFGWGGRIWGELYALLFLSLPKSIFNIINTIGYLLLVALIYINITGKYFISVSLFLFINFSLWICLPAFGQDILWVSGCANYMWSMLIPLLFLAGWRIYIDKEYKVFSNCFFIIAVFFLGVMAGWANENVSVGIIWILLCFMMTYKIKYRKVPVFSVVGLLGTIIGAGFLILAPGNFVRFAAEHHSKSLLKMARSIVHNIFALVDFNTALLLLIFLFIFLIVGKSKNKALALILMSAAFISSMAFGVTGHIHSRVFFGPVILLIISTGMVYIDCFKNINEKEVILKFSMSILLALGIYFLFTYARNGIKDYGYRNNENIKIIEMEKARGNLDVTVNPITPLNRFCAAYMLDDIQPKENNQHWLNKGVASYYKLHTIQSVHLEEK